VDSPLNLAKVFLRWLVAVSRVWWGWLPSSSIAALFGFGDHIIKWSSPRWIWITVLVLGVAYSAFEAWRREWVENRDGPQIAMSWDSVGQPWHKDAITFRNVGSSSAFNIRLIEFSWPEISQVYSVELQALHSGKALTLHPSLIEKDEDSSPSVAYLSRILHVSRYRDRKPLEVKVAFSDVNRTQFVRTFVLRSIYPLPGVMVDIGDLEVKRPL